MIFGQQPVNISLIDRDNSGHRFDRSSRTSPRLDFAGPCRLLGRLFAGVDDLHGQSDVDLVGNPCT
jgi:hypothetical protein